MKAMSKQQLADCAGVSVKTLMDWCKRYRAEVLGHRDLPGVRKARPRYDVRDST